jgi:hypothetical protein
MPENRSCRHVRAPAAAGPGFDGGIVAQEVPDLKGGSAVRVRSDGSLRPQHPAPAASWRTRLVCILILLLALPRSAAAADPLLTVTKDTLLGAVTGLVLGGTLTLVIDDEGKRSETVRWGVVIGTFAGFGFGIYHATRGDGDLFAVGDPHGITIREKLQLSGGSDTLTLAAVAGAARERCAERCKDVSPAALTEGATPGWSLRLPLVQVNW